MAQRVLVVDDEPDMVENCARILKRAGLQCLTATDPRRALALVETERPDLLLTDVKMPGMDGMELLRRAREVDPALPVVLITAFATIESAVAAIKDGAFDYLPKNFSVEQLRVAVERGLRQRELQIENRNLRDQLQGTLGFENILGRSPAMARVFELVRKAARSEANILVLGESGTGKELIARAIHANSPRAAQPFVPVDCASLPEQLLESELFGHEKGAFTGAVKGKRGLMEVADRGTLFLDEIAEMPVVLQVKLLRALQERQLRRVGGTATIDVDARVVSATNRDLRAAVAKGQFREELYYRVNVIEIPLPPLRDRAGDVRLLAHAFLKRYGGERVRAFEEAALETLEAWAWPGNVRELQNVVERACALADGDRVGRQDLPDYLVQGRGLRAAGAAPAAGAALPAGATADLPLKDAKEKWMQVLEAAYLRDLLERHGGNISAAAKAAGIDRKTFHRLINKYQIRG
ncbi:MAG: sigma-54-dependent Fis family transcriptional regulator [Candidatus Rokubacteria bacterium]|nr:sigma-54-dependent Fis family transcriptional regulator [Candidatus Rokubacteria bacterium]MBI4253432.1 sigma-54-dependent Fis family transcriptional regulator [Candidatus Rokubacteria bacterium]MBI4629490.1 sigma-54-dependent Fis family transcriptional regulator [Candidatus Rokubacteria bacterium]